MNPNEYFSLKIVALLHDSPFKPILYACKEGDLSRLVNSCIEEELCKRVYGDFWKEKGKMDEHELLALYIIARVYDEIKSKKSELTSNLINTVKREFKNKVNRCDIASRSIDRSIFNLMYGKEFINRITYKHPVDLSERDFTNEIRQFLYYNNELREEEFKEAVNEFLRRIVKLICETENGYEFHVLWRALMPAFIDSVRKAFKLREYSWLSLLPADTRAPTSTIFDHLYATSALATAVNDEYIGLIYWEVDGKQDFISRARAPRDLWAGSYLISILTLAVIKELVDELGPDCVIRPNLYNIPLYEHYLKSCMKREGIQKIKLEDAQLSVVPGAVLAIVPGSKVIDYVKNILNWYRESWLKIVEIFKSKNKLETIKLEYGDLIADDIIEVDEDSYEKQVNEPPFDVSIVYFKVPWDKDKRKKFMEKLRDELLILKEDIDVLNNIEEFVKGREIYTKHDFYEWPYLIKGLTFLHYTSSRTKSECVIPNEPLDVKDRREWCTVCWRRKRVVGFKDLTEVVGEEKRKRMRDLLGKLHAKEGERLCLHCLIKRTLREELEKVIKELISKKLSIEEDEKEIAAYPSTESIAGLSFAYSLLSLLKKVPKDKFKEINENLFSIIADYCTIYGMEKTIFPRSTSYNTLKEEICSIFGLEGKQFVDQLQDFFTSLYEEHYLRGLEIDRKRSDEARKMLRELFKKINEILEGMKLELKLKFLNLKDVVTLCKREAKYSGCLVRGLSDYYALIKADGDSIGELISATGLYSRKVRDLMPKLLYEYLVGLGSGVEQRAKALEKEQNILDLKCPPPLSYVYAVSKSLTTISIKAFKIINDVGGLVVYSGGDDLLALLPVEISLQTIADIRSLFSESHIIVEDSFLPVKVEYELPGLGRNASQSVGVLFVDAFYPLKRGIEIASEMVENAKKVEYDIGKKDCLLISYLTRGGMRMNSYIPFKLVNCKEGIMLILELALRGSIGSDKHDLFNAGRTIRVVKGFSDRLLRVTGDISREENFTIFKVELEKAGVEKEIIDYLAQLRNYKLLTPDYRSSVALELIKAALCLCEALRESRPIAIGDEV